MHSTIHAVCGQQKGQNRAKSHVWLIYIFFIFLVKRAGRHDGFFKRAGRHEKGAGRRALQKKPRQNTDAAWIALTHPMVTMSTQSTAQNALAIFLLILLQWHGSDIQGIDYIDIQFTDQNMATTLLSWQDMMIRKKKI